MDGSIVRSESAETTVSSRLDSRVFEALVGEITRLAFAVTAGQIPHDHFLLELENRLALLWSLRHNVRVRTALAKGETLMNADAILASARKMAELAELIADLGGDGEQERRETRERKEAKEREEREERTSVSVSVPAHPKPETEIPEINPKPKPKQGATTAHAQRGLDECDPARPDSDSASASASASVGARGLSVSDSPSTGVEEGC